MNRKKKLSLVSSTPHLRKSHKLAFELENDDISPITTKIEQIKKATKQAQTVIKRTRSTAEVDSEVLKKKKCVPKQEKESASSAALKEMGVKGGLRSTNFLYKSRNMYNMFPQPVILDSDDEIDLQPKQVTTSNLGLKKKNSLIKPSATSTRVKDVNGRGPNKQADECITTNQCKIKVKEDPNKITSVHETPQPPCSKPRTMKKNLFSKPITTGSSEQINKAKNKHTETIQLITDSDDEDGMFPVNICSAKKNTHLKRSSLKYILDDSSAIKWTPRSKTKNLKMIKEKYSESESFNSDSDDCSVLKTINVSDTFNNRANKENCKDNNKNNVKNKRIEQKNSFPEELFSRFADIVFHPSKQNKGSVVASSLVTGSFEFGYVELGEDKLFTGKLKNITFVLMEGQVKALFQGKTLSLSPGDMLYINEDSGYQLRNSGTGHARFLYAKEKRS